jgi:L-alanine-DL-glutamate epimerase-like enolase superfamily enzyme
MPVATARSDVAGVAVERVDVAAYTVPTDFPESDGTFAWDHTTMVLVEVSAGDCRGLGFSYAAGAAARLVRDSLAGVVTGCDAMAVPATWAAMIASVRNVGRPGIAMAAISAVDVALWDLKARLLDVPLVTLLGAARPGAPVYGSGGFTSYPVERLQAQLRAWVESGIPRVKMKVGRQPADDVARVRAAREAIGPAAALLVDANGAYARKEALAFAEAFAASGVTWFEEPVSSDDLEGLRLVRDRAPAGMAIAAGEYGWDAFYFERMLAAGAVDVLQADATRCGGITGFLAAATVADARSVPISAHTAPSIHLHPCCAVSRLRHLEYFHDHVRIERLLLDGAIDPVAGVLTPDLSRPGLGLTLRRRDAERYAVR